jgi:2'-5' RNA ligase
MRVFVAIVLSADNQRVLRAAVRPLVEAHASVLRGIPDRTAHVTMAFLGAVEERDLAAIGEAMQGVARSRGPVAIELSGPKVLRSRKDPRLVMLPVRTGAAQLDAIAHDLHAAIAARLPSLDLSPAKGAHVTLARFRKHARPSDGRAVEQSLTGSGLASLVLHDEVCELRLFESQLGPGGPQYAQLQTAQFR